MDKLSGKWKGRYWCGDGYPVAMQDRAEPFELELTFKEGKVVGTCTDAITQQFFTQPATIEGLYADNYISFIKRYPSFVVVDNEENLVRIPERPSHEIHYTGGLSKGVLWSGYQFKGEWSITDFIVNEQGERQYCTLYGTWSMKQMK